ncbi:hypothetical protein [Roseivirga echinicomitans]|uniref:Uncharacterized protein n=1 Tax=Roseivirga echinicomitans TaxID=296218 RepID=A0A150X225_9BACT|nr:hypothetical protein [Roseivirga echinicomitans]KYG72785.1 hypothetical protein AWN68_08765 [Roseivirga echinicomitans]
MKFIGNINLSNQEDYQAIYASQLYGTFFCVFGKFTCLAIEKDEYTLDKIEFKIINYKGIINLGISDVKGIFDLKDGAGNIIKAINIEVRGLCEADEFQLNCSGVKLNKNELLIAERTVKPMHEEVALSGSVFDNEYYYREGLPDLDGLFSNRSPQPMSVFNQVAIFKEFPGTICPRGTNRII